VRGTATPPEFGAVLGATVNKDAPGTFSCSEALVVAAKKVVHGSWVCRRLLSLLEALNQLPSLRPTILGATTQLGCSEL